MKIARVWQYIIFTLLPNFVHCPKKATKNLNVFIYYISSKSFCEMGKYEINCFIKIVLTKTPQKTRHLMFFRVYNISNQVVLFHPTL